MCEKYLSTITHNNAMAVKRICFIVTKFSLIFHQAMEQWHRLRRSLSDEQDANDACRSAMNTTSVQMCSSIPGFDLESYINNCALDAMVSRY